MRREIADTDLELSFSFSVVVLRRACLLVLSSQFHGGCETLPLQTSPKIGAIIFGNLCIVVTSVQLSSLHHCVWCPKNSFPLFYYVFPQQLFRWVSSSQSKPVANFFWYIYIFNSFVCCYDYPDFRNLPFSFLFISPFSACLFCSLSISLSLCLPRLSFSCMFLSFLSSCGWPVTC